MKRVSSGEFPAKAPMTLSDEANGSHAAHASKSAFSDTISNPDLDEYFFNKPSTAAPGATISAFIVGAAAK